MTSHFSDTDPKIEKMQIEILRQMSPERKLKMVGELNRTVKTLALAGLRSRYPNDPPEKIYRRLADLLLGPELAEKAFGPLEE
jgi:hypothetical protein